VNRTLLSWLAGAITALTLAGCLFRTSEVPRFYRPASAALDDIGAPQATPPTEGAPIRLQTVHSAPFLRERIVWRASPVEYGLYEQRRWFELPSRYVRRALVTTLRETPGLRLGDDTSAPRLDVEILAFDEVLAPRHEASVALAVTLRDSTRKRLDHTFSAQVAIVAGDGAAMAQAMGQALDEVVREVAQAAVTELVKKPPTAARAGRK
jgi:ABC-type uncharacterized transport system auxiliary subunit